MRLTIMAPIAISSVEAVDPTSKGTKYAPICPITSRPKSSILVNSNGSRFLFETIRMAIARTKKLTTAIMPSVTANHPTELLRIANSPIAGAKAARPSSTRTSSGGRGGGRSCTLAMLQAAVVSPGGCAPPRSLRSAGEPAARREGLLVASSPPIQPSVRHRCDRRFERRFTGA